MTSKLLIAYRCQRNKAKCRGIEFLLSFDEWLKIWINSGKLELRGRKKGQYVMSRPGDKGPYSVRNVRIVQNNVNQNEVFIGRKLSDSQKQLLREASSRRRGWKHTEEAKRKISEARMGKRPNDETRAKLSKAAKGRIKSPETRLKLSIGRKGKLHSEESKLKMRLARLGHTPWNKGRPHSEETKAKIGARARERHANA